MFYSEINSKQIKCDFFNYYCYYFKNSEGKFQFRSLHFVNMKQLECQVENVWGKKRKAGSSFLTKPFFCSVVLYYSVSVVANSECVLTKDWIFFL